MCTTGHVADVRERPGGQHYLAGDRWQLVDDLLDGDHRALGREYGLLLDTGDAPHAHVSGAVGALGMDDRHVWVEGRHGGELLTGERAGDRLDRGGLLDQIRSPVAA